MLDQDAVAAILRAFQQRFPGVQHFGDGNEVFETSERNYKLELCQLYDAWFRQTAPRPLSTDADRHAFADDIERLFTQPLKANANKPQNLVNWRYMDVIRKLDSDMRARLPQLVVALLDEQQPVEARIDAFVAGLAELAARSKPTVELGDAASRSLTTFLLFVADPRRHLYIKTQEVNRFLKAVGQAPMAAGLLSGAEYRRVLSVAQALREHLVAQGWAPRDMIDVQSLIWVAMAYGADSDEKDDDAPPAAARTTDDGAPMSPPLNRILYGPPGTGKTYDTARLAVEICDGSAPPDREALMQRYSELADANRIKFVSFHQSFSYEDFVEGIRPVEAEDANAGIRYETRPGVFRKICSLAARASTKSEGGRVELRGRRLFKMSLGNTQIRDEDWVYDECVQNDYVLLGFGFHQDFAGCDTSDAVWKRMHEVEPEIARNDYHVTAINYLKNELKTGDLVLISDGNRKFRALAEVTGEYWHIAGRDDFDQARGVRWLAVFEESLPIETIFEKVLSQASIYRMDQKAVKWDALQDLVDQVTAPGAAARQSYVLIVDEINRANIAKVMGELITLLEPDKRLGAANELKVELPYSGERFGVPGNLYIVGTMNTADRSIALLDTALRRRFDFRAVMPDPRAIPGTGDGRIPGDSIFSVDLRQLLQALNARIEYLLGRDHQLGHAYFTQVRSLDQLEAVFRDKVIPLLQEYFHDDWGMIAKVLSPEFIIADEVSGDALFAHAGGLDEGRMPPSFTRYRIAPSFSAEMFVQLYAGLVDEPERTV